MAEQNPNRYPVDIDALKKGDTIPISKLVQWAGAEPHTAKYKLAGMKLASTIEMVKESIGDPMFCRWVGSELRVMTDDEAVDRLHQRVMSATRTMGVNVRRQVMVDTSGLEADRKKAHEHRTITNSRMLQAMRRARLDKGGDAKLLNE